MRIPLNKSNGLTLTIEYEPGSISFGILFGHSPYDCGWIGIRLPFLIIEVDWRSPRYDCETL